MRGKLLVWEISAIDFSKLRLNVFFSISRLVFQYEELAKEMQEVQERLVFLEGQKKQAKDRFKTRLEEAAKVDEEWMVSSYDKCSTQKRANVFAI